MQKDAFGAVILYTNCTIPSLIQTLQLCCVHCRFWNFTKSTAKRVTDYTVGRELHPAPKNCLFYFYYYDTACLPTCQVKWAYPMDSSKAVKLLRPSNFQSSILPESHNCARFGSIGSAAATGMAKLAATV